MPVRNKMGNPTSCRCAILDLGSSVSLPGVEVLASQAVCGQRVGCKPGNSSSYEACSPRSNSRERM